MSSTNKTTLRRIHRFLNLQNSTIRYYKKAAFITTDDGLKNVLQKIIIAHEDIRGKLLIRLDSQFDLSSRFRRVFGLLERIQRKFTIALILDTKAKVLEYIWQSECKILQEMYPMRDLLEEDTLLIALLQEYQQQIENNLTQIEVHINQTTHKQLVF